MNNCSAKELNSTNHKKETAQNLLSIPLTINHSESIKRGEKREKERERQKCIQKNAQGRSRGNNATALSISRARGPEKRRSTVI